MRTPARTLLSAVAAAAAVLGGVAAPPAQAAPAFGDVPLVVLACHFPDSTATARRLSELRAVVRGTGDSLDTRVRALSGGHASLAGAPVRGWYAMSLRAADRPSVPTVVSACRSAATAAGVALAATDRVLVVVDSGHYRPGTTEPYGTVIDQRQPLSAWEHALGHVLGLEDAWSLDPATGEYRVRDDEYSVMGNYGQAFPQVLPGARPGLNAYELDRLSWLDRSLVVTAGADGRATTTVDLAPLDRNPNLAVQTPGVRLLRVPFDRFDPEHYYTVELRAHAGLLDTPAEYGGGVLIHEVRNGIPVLLRDNSIATWYDEAGRIVWPGRWPVQELDRGGVRITTSAAGGDNQVRVTVTTPVVTQCLPGYAPRLARPADAVCVTGARVAATAEANRLAPTRWAVGPDGPHTCVTGYVWREAFTGDDVCVTPAERSTVADENRTAGDRVNPARLTGGPNWCLSGYVWREADPTDHVCVSPARRGEVAREIIRTTSLDVPCPQFTYRRRAWPADLVCSTVASRSLVASENVVAPTRVRAL